jgi:hypothetical protein
MLSDRNAAVRGYAAVALADISATESISTLVRVAKEERSSRARSRFYYALLLLGHFAIFDDYVALMRRTRAANLKAISKEIEDILSGSLTPKQRRLATISLAKAQRSTKRRAVRVILDKFQECIAKGP